MAIPIAVPLAISAGTALGGLLGKRKKPKPVDVTPLISTIKQGAERQRQMTTALRPSLQPFTEQFRTGTGQAVGTAGTERGARTAQYIQDVERTFSPETEAKLASTLSHRVLEQQPALAQQQREALAASGGLQRG